MLRRDLLDHVDLQCFHFLNPDAPDLERHCRDYEAEIGGRFDVAILGLGLNGHLGLNEPGALPDSLTRRVEMTPQSIAASRAYLAEGEPPTWGLTVGMKALLQAREVWLLATGAAKAAIVKSVVCGDVTPAVPASLLHRHPRCTLFLDGAAAGALW